jgi:hypothetical protein
MRDWNITEELDEDMGKAISEIVCDVLAGRA